MAPIAIDLEGLCARVDGAITTTGGSESFTVSASSGQYMVVNIIPTTKFLGTAGNVVFPSGSQGGGPGGIIMNQNLSETGIYTITVSVNQMSSQVQIGDFVLEVILLPQWIFGKSAQE